MSGKSPQNHRISRYTSHEVATQGARSAPRAPLGEGGDPRTGDAESGAVPTSLARRIDERYRSLYPIGRGGMGLVEVALELGPPGSDGLPAFQRVVALKRLLPEGKRDKRHTEMFLREARLAALLKHPNVVHAFDFGEADEELFLAMEYIEGEPLSRVLAATRERGTGLDPALAAYVLAEICDGLHAAHELEDERGARLNVVHRDVSPHNVMVAYEGHVKLLDFGVAKIEAEAGLTKTGEVKGKVAYMSPEQAMGDPLDRRSDIYSVGACLFECLAGRRMWEGTDMEVLRHLALDPPPRLEQVAPFAPIELCRLYDRLVAREPGGRPSTAHEVAGELRAFAARVSRRVDAEVIEALMARLFSSDMERRRAQMEAALRDVAPTDADALRRSVAPPRSTATTTGPMAAIAAPPVTTPGEEPKRGRAALAILIFAAVALVAGGALYALRGSPFKAVAGGGAPHDVGDTPGSTTGGTTGGPAESATAIVPRTNTIEIESKGTPVHARPAPARPPTTKPKGSGSSKVVDVDPNPI